MRYVGVLSLVFALIAAACSSGVSEEEHENALADARSAQARVAELEEEATNAAGELSALEAERSAAESRADELGSQLETAREEMRLLEDELRAAEDATTRALARYESLVDLSGVPFEPGATLIAVLLRGSVRCGVHSSFPGWSEIDDSGDVSGFDTDYCRAIAAAVLGDSEAVEFVPVGGAQRFIALQSGDVDVVIRTTTHTLRRDAALGETADFGPTIFYDGQQFLGNADRFTTESGAADLDGARLCVAPESPEARLAQAYAATAGATPTLVPNTADVAAGIGLVADETCDLITFDGSALASFLFRAVRSGAIAAGDLVIFPSSPIDREPLGPGYRQGDTVWADVVNWVVFATILADEKGIDSTNIDSTEWDPEARRLFGVEGQLVTMLGLDPDALYRVIAQVGNYGEIFERNLGPLGLTQDGTPNSLHTEGGLLYAPPVR